MNHDYAELLTLIGKAVVSTPVPQRCSLKRFSWFSIEFGLIQEDNETKIFGAGILSSTARFLSRFPTMCAIDVRDERGDRDRL